MDQQLEIVRIFLDCKKYEFDHVHKYNMERLGYPFDPRYHHWENVVLDANIHLIWNRVLTMYKAEYQLDDIQHYYHHVVVVQRDLSIVAQVSITIIRTKQTPGTTHDTTKFWTRKKKIFNHIFLNSLYLHWNTNQCRSQTLVMIVRQCVTFKWLNLNIDKTVTIAEKTNGNDNIVVLSTWKIEKICLIR